MKLDGDWIPGWFGYPYKSNLLGAFALRENTPEVCFTGLRLLTSEIE